MGIRITVVMDDDVNKHLRKLQSKQIQSSERSVSFSSVLNSELKQRFKI